MATRTRSRSAGQATPTVTFKSKSDWARHHLTAGRTIAEVKALSTSDPGSLGPMDYAFVYGVAKRYGLAETAANRKRTARVKVDPDSGIVTLRLDTGSTLRVDLATGKVTRK